MQFAFWVSIVLLGYTFAGYPIFMRLLARRLPDPAARRDGYTPSVTAVIAAHNAGPIIAERVRNLLGANYPADRLRVIVASDGSTDDTAANARAAGGDRTSVLEFAQRRGKPACLNDAIAAADCEIIVLADARQRFDPGAIRALVQSFADPGVGAVSGALQIAASESGVGEGIGGYWKIERALRADESDFGSAVGCTGAIYAIRRELYRPLPADTLIDDVVIPLSVAQRGHRILFERSAQAFDPQPLDGDKERIRKRRTLGGNFQMLFRYPAWLLPWGHPLWWQIISHKYLRVLAPLLLLVALLSNICLAISSPAYAAILAAHLGGYAAALAGLCTPLGKYRLFAIPASFLFLNLMSVAGLLYYLRSTGRDGW